MKSRRILGVVAIVLASALVLGACKPWDKVTPYTHAIHVQNLSANATPDQLAYTSLCVRSGQANLWNPLCSGAMPYTYLNWSTDGCSAGLPDKTYWYDFTSSCIQHDFCYRNWPEVRAHGANYNTEQVRQACDTRFRYNMYDDCDEVFVAIRIYCMNSADGAYAGVRLFGVMHSDRI